MRRALGSPRSSRVKECLVNRIKTEPNWKHRPYNYKLQELPMRATRKMTDPSLTMVALCIGAGSLTQCTVTPQDDPLGESASGANLKQGKNEGRKLVEVYTESQYHGAPVLFACPEQHCGPIDWDIDVLQ